ncbi:MAG: hypothetical protein Q4F29_03550 [Lachnospiraceae bacterium]|nr:hypothetical protein [Lachnospiraceae bacterium]
MLEVCWPAGFCRQAVLIASSIRLEYPGRYFSISILLYFIVNALAAGDSSAEIALVKGKKV